MSNFRFSLQQLLLLTTVVGVCLGIAIGIAIGIGPAFFLPYLILVMLAAFYKLLLDARLTNWQRALLLLILLGIAWIFVPTIQ